MGIWQVVQLVAALPLVVLPFVAQAKESLRPPMNTPSLGTFGIVMMAAVYFFAIGLVNGFIVGNRLAWPWYGSLGLAAAAAGTGTFAAYWLLYSMAATGGKAWTIAGGVGLGLLFVANLIGPRFVPAA